ncbi:MAG: PKD domain-containing protein [Deltaproteobacteria bacterium]|nr:PKD domain-containing protein [Deltaproteobacteria bacterium]
MQPSRTTRVSRQAISIVIAMGLYACGDDPPKADRTPPVVTIDEPVEGARLEPGDLVVRGSVIDPKKKGERRSGVVSVTVDGVDATVAEGAEARAFEATLLGLAPGTRTIEVVATDAKGNLGSARVQVVVEEPVVPPEDLVGIVVEPATILLERVGATVRPGVHGYRSGAPREDVAALATLAIEDEAVATVAADGTITAVGEGATRLLVRLDDLEATARVVVVIDDTPPPTPEILTYRPETNLRSQTWLGKIEPHATITVTGGERTVTETAGRDGRIMFSIPLVHARLNPLVARVTDVHGNFTDFQYPVRQNDAFVDPGLLKLSEGDHQRGFAGERLPSPLVVRATDPFGAPLPNLDVDFIVTDGGGSVIGARGEEGARVRVRTDGGGRARVEWRLGETVGPRHEVHAALVGDGKLPVVFSARGFARGAGPTTIVGRVFDDARNPVVGLDVTLLEEGSEFAIDSTGKTVQTDGLGRFEIGYAPEMTEPEGVRFAHVRFDGTRRAAGDKYVRIDYVVPVLPRLENNGGAFYVPALPEGVALDLDAQGVVQTAVTLERSMAPGEPPTRVHVPVGTKVTWPANVPADARKLALLDIPVSSTPMPPPDGLFTRHVLALQPGGTRFDPPLPVELPNLDRIPPGEGVPVMSYDHLQTRFVRTGSATVGADGAYIMSDPGSGIRVGAWHLAPPNVPPPPCPSEATVEAGPPPGPEDPPPEQKECICEECGVRWTCLIPEIPEEPDKPMPSPNPPCTSPAGPDSEDPGEEEEPEPECKRKVICEEEGSVVITSPTEKKKTVKTNDTVALRARCPDSKNDPSITWKTTGGAFQGGTSGPTASIKFAEEGKYTVTAKGGTDKECEGTDDAIIEVRNCLEAGIVRVCGLDIDAPDKADGKVTGSVTVGVVGSDAGQFLRVDQPVTLKYDATSDAYISAQGDGTWRMDTKVAFFDLKDLTIWKGVFTIDKEGKIDLSIPPHLEANPEKHPLNVFSIPIFVRGGQLLASGVSYDTPDFKLFGGSPYRSIQKLQCSRTQPVGEGAEPGDAVREPACQSLDHYDTVEEEDPRKLELMLTGIEIRTAQIVPQGKLALDSELDFGAFKLSKLGLEYANNEFTGAVSVILGKKWGQLGLDFTTTYGVSADKPNDWRWKKVGLTANFKREFGIGTGIFIPGVPIPPTSPMGPLFFSSVGITVEEPDFLMGGEVGTPKFSLSGGFAFGPGLKVGGEDFAPAVGELVGSISPEEIGINTTVKLLGRLEGTFAGFEGKENIQDLLTATAGLTLSYPSDRSTGIKLKADLGLALKEPFFGGTVATGAISGSAATVRNPAGLLINVEGKASLFFPENKYFRAIELLGAEGKFRFRTRQGRTPEAEVSVAITQTCLGDFVGKCTYVFDDEVKRGPRIYFRAGDLAVQILGPHPDAPTPGGASAPGLGVGRGVPASLVYEGLEPAFDVLDRGVLNVVMRHSGGAIAADLELPSGDILSAEGAPYFVDGELVALFQELPGLDGDTDESYWLVADAMPGAYRLVNVRGAGQLSEVTAALQPALPTFEFDDVDVADGVATLSWSGTAEQPLSVAFSAQRLDGDGSETIDEVMLSEGVLLWDLADVPPGTYRVSAHLNDGRSGPVTVRAHDLVVVGPASNGISAGLVRAVDGPSGIEVSWLPAVDAKYYGVARLVAGQVADELTVLGPSTRAVLPGSLADGDSVRVTATRKDGEANAPEVVASTRAPVVTRPPSEVLAGETWAWLAERADGTPADVRVVAGPAPLTLVDDVLTFPTTVDDLGVHELTLVVDGYERRLTIAVREVLIGNPEVPRDGPPDATVGAPWVWDLELDPAAFDVVQMTGPAVTIADGVVTWTPTVEDAVAAQGRVLIGVSVTDRATGASAEASTLVVIADRDGDGLDDAWELASGLDPDVADDPGDDPDEDGLDHAAEEAAGTRGDLADSDRDGLDDGDETVTSARDADTDGDGLVDGAEGALGADPTKVDTDGDGVDDPTEVAAGSPPGQGSPDGDGDGLSDQEELELGSDPALADTDGDGLDDGDEALAGTRFLAVDTDGDGASDGAEVAAGTDPLRRGVDRDGDGLFDDHERVLGTHVSLSDTDGDGFPDGTELLAGTDPKVATSRPVDEERPTANPMLLYGESDNIAREPWVVSDLGVIKLYPDADRDRVPDDFEVRYDFDPTDPTDGSSDTDGDNVPLWREHRLGTDPTKADTDGDGASDGQELADGTDPKDPESFVAGGPISELAFVPGRAALFTNTIIGPATLQLRVVGRRATGVETDITAADRGTTYVVQPAAAGAVSGNGYFVADRAYAGEATVTATNNALQATMTLIIERFTPGKVGEVLLPATPGRLAVSGDTLVVVAGKSLCAVDVTLREAPALGGCLPLAATIHDVALRGTLGYVIADSPARLIEIDAADVGAGPRIVRSIELPATPRSLALGDARVYVATDAGLLTIDPSAIDDEPIVGTELPDRAMTFVRRDLDRVATLDAQGILRGWRVIAGGLVLETTATTEDIDWDLAFRGNEVWAADLNKGVRRTTLSSTGGFQASATGIFATRVVPFDDVLLIGIRGPQSLLFVDNRVPGQLPALGTIDYVQTDPTGLAVDDEYHYMAGFGGGAPRLEIGRHAAYVDVLGVPPVVTPVLPEPGVVVDEGPSLAVQVAAYDDVRLREVRIFVDDALAATRTTAPYKVVVQTPGVSADTAVTIRAEAEDIGANVGSFEPYTITVRPVVDTTPPVLRFVEPLDGECVGAGPLRVEVNPVDEYGIDRVELRRDGVLVATLEDAPWVTTIDISGEGAGTLTATAIDFGENTDVATATLDVMDNDLVKLGVTRIAPGDTTYDDERVLVREGTVAIDGPHAFEALCVGRRGVLTHSDAAGGVLDVGLDIAAESLIVSPGGAIDVSGRGHRGQCVEACDSPNASPPSVGGSHGGIGGWAGLTPAPYGDLMAPTTLGMGGGYGNSTNWDGANGGGRIRLVADEMEIHGAVRADGVSNLGPSGVGGGGAGGSVLLDVGVLVGTGSITAEGGTASSRGAGGGGRIAILYGTSDFDFGRVRARPGVAVATAEAGPGTVVLRPDGARATIVIDDGGRSALRDNSPLGSTPSATPWVADLDLVVRGRSRVVAVQPLHLHAITLEGAARLSSLESVPPDERGLDLDVARLVVGPEAAIDVIARGHQGACRPGTACSAPTAGAGSQGGSHGGVGGGGSGAPTYDDPKRPTMLGMGGGYGNSTNWHGGDGGGRVRIVATTFTLDGRLTADGLENPSNVGVDGQAAGGAGGSIWVTAETIAGSGSITADGGVSHARGSGGGGRIALEYDTLSAELRQNTFARPGGKAQIGGPGSVYFAPSSGQATFVIDDGGRGAIDSRPFGFEPASEPLVLDADLIVRGSTRLVVGSPITVGELTLEGTSVLTHVESDGSYDGGLTVVADTIVVGPDAAIDVTARGYQGACRPGTSCSSATAGAASQGGSHGGVGGGGGGAPTYGDPKQPTTLGMGGGYGNSTSWHGGDGGGRVRIVATTFTLDGRLAADGLENPNNAGVDGQAAGGAGGSIWVTAETIAGGGSITADGGVSHIRGSGGGGRIALEYGTLSAELRQNTFARPGDKAQVGGPGTVYFAPASGQATFVVDDGGRGAIDSRPFGFAPSSEPLVLEADLFVRGSTRLVVGSPITVGELTLEGTSVLTHVESDGSYEGGLTVVADTIEVGPTAAIDVTARGYQGACRPGTPCDSATAGAASQGGSHGGVGGGGGGAPTYGDPKQPTTLGMGGGYGNSTNWHGGDGGGRVRIIATTFTLDGRLAADGLENPFNVGVDGQAAGGAGGSIWVTADTIAGSGTITADGGVSHIRGSGGGGRIALEFDTLSPTLRANTFARPGAKAQIGGPGTVYFADGSGDATFVIDDGGRAATDSRPFGFATASQPLVLDADVVVRGSTRLVAAYPLTVRALTLEGTSVLTHVPTQAGYEGGLTVVADTIEIGPTAMIDVSGRGYAGQCTPRAGGCGTGGGTFGNVLAGAPAQAGGSHGGVGGNGPSRTFGDPLFPTTLGGGGGYGNSTNWHGGHGGGRIHLAAERVVIDGELRADGEPPSGAGTLAGGGAGGSILVVADVLVGDGLVRANGAAIATGSGGAGGRIALRYGALDDQRPFDLDAGEARGGAGVDAARSGGPGTFWVVADGARGVLRVDNGGLAHVNEAAPWAEVGRAKVVSADGDEVTTDATWWVDDLVGLTLVRASDRSTGVITGNDASLLLLAAPTTAVVGDAVHGRRVLPGAWIIEGASRVALHDEVVVDALTLTTGAVLTHPVTPGTAAERGLWVEVVGAASIDATSAIDVGGRGYAGECTPLSGTCGAARTLGNVATGSGAGEGGSYGGLGAGASPNPTYGDAAAPFDLGSGGGRGSSTSWHGGHGGGRVHLAAGSLALGGLIAADGVGGGSNGTAGAGSGGAIRLVIGSLGGAGVIHARGGAFGIFGGGGRVRVDAGADTFTGQIDAAAGGAGAGAGSVVRD